MAFILKRGLLLLVWLQFSFSLAAAPVKHKKLDKRVWTFVKSPNFEIVSDAKPKQLLKMVEQLERFRAFLIFYLSLESGRSVETAQATKLLLTNKRSSWLALGMPRDLISYNFITGNGSRSVFAEIGGWGGYTGESMARSTPGRATILRALAVGLLQDFGMLDGRPVWYRTAIASYLSGYVENEDYFRLGDPGAMGRRLKGLYDTNGRFISIDIGSVMSMEKNTSVTGGRDQRMMERNRFLSQSYVLLHYMLADRARAQQLMAYLIDEKIYSSLVEKIEVHFLMAPRKISRLVRSYVESNPAAIAFKRSEVEALISNPSVVDFHSASLSYPEFWRWTYPQIAKMPDDIISDRHKKELHEKIKVHMPNLGFTLEPVK